MVGPARVTGDTWYSTVPTLQLHEIDNEINKMRLATRQSLKTRPGGAPGRRLGEAVSS